MAETYVYAIKSYHSVLINTHSLIISVLINFQVQCLIIFFTISRLVDIVERRNEIIECLEMDRVREAEEDSYINDHINLYTSKRDSEKGEPEELPKEKDKDKKKKHKKESKSKSKNKNKIDVDKDIDESEPHYNTEKKKKKKFNLF